MATLDARQLGLAGGGSPESPAAVAAFNRAMRGLSGQNVVTFPPGLFQLADSLFVPSNTTFTGLGILQQTKANTPIFLGDGVSNVAWENLTLIGLGTDYHNVPSGGPSTACGIEITGRSPNSDIRLSGCRLRSFGWAGVFVANTSDLLLEETWIEGPGSPLIPAAGNGCFGLGFYSPYSKVQVRSCRFTGMAVAILGDHIGSDVKITDSWFWDIPGQHGVYLEHAHGVTVSGCTFRNIHYDAIKVQHDTLGLVQEAGSDITFTENLFAGIGGKPMNVVNNGDPRFDFSGLTISDNVMQQQGMLDDGIYLAGCHNARILNNTTLGGRNGLRLQASSGITAQHNHFLSPAQCGVAVGSPKASSRGYDCTQINVLDNTILDAAQSGLVGYTFGVGLWSTSATTVARNTINDGSGRATAAIAQTRLADPTTLHLVGNRGFGLGISLLGPIAESHDNHFTS